jgi:hypothetical protein
MTVQGTWAKQHATSCHDFTFTRKLQMPPARFETQQQRCTAPIRPTNAQTAANCALREEAPNELQHLQIDRWRMQQDLESRCQLEDQE